MFEVIHWDKYDLIQQEHVIKAKDIADFLSYLQFTESIEHGYINSQLTKRGIMHTPGYTRSADAVVDVIDFLHTWLTQKWGHDTDRIYTTEFTRALQKQIDHMQVLSFGPATKSVVVDFSHKVMETIIQDGNSIERTFVQRQWKIDAVLQNEALTHEEKKNHLQEVLELWLTKAPVYVGALLGKLRSYIPEIDIQGLPSFRKLALAATVAWTLLYTTQSTHKTTLQEVAALDGHTWKEIWNHKAEFRSLMETPTHPSSKKHTSKHTPKAHEVRKDKTIVMPHEEQKTAIKSGEDRPLVEFMPLPKKQLNEVFSSTPKNMKKTVLWWYILYRDPVSWVFYWQVKTGETLDDLRSALVKDERFGYLEGGSYKPRNGGNVLSRNIDPDNLKIGQFVPIPLDHTETTLTDTELRNSAIEAIKTITLHQRYGEFMQHLTEELGAEHLAKVMCAVAKKESTQWSTSMYRYEPGHGRFSYGIYHVLDSWPGRTALQQLGFSSGQVMADPAKAGQWFRAYCYEKLTDMQYSTTYKSYISHPEKLFKKRNLAKLWTLYNGSEDYGKDLKKVYYDLD